MSFRILFKRRRSWSRRRGGDREVQEVNEIQENDGESDASGIPIEGKILSDEAVSAMDEKGQSDCFICQSAVILSSISTLNKWNIKRFRFDITYINT